MDAHQGQDGLPRLPLTEAEGEGSIVCLEVDGRRVVLVGTAHISQESVETVARVLENESPDVVCVELDEDRHRALTDLKWWEGLDLMQVIRQGRAPFLIANLVLSTYQKRMGLATGVRPGTELAEAARLGREREAEVILCDRPIRTTLRRAWRQTPFCQKLSLLGGMLGSFFVPGETVTEEELARLRRGDVLSGLLTELGEAMPALKTVLVDERDRYMASQIAGAGGQCVVAVVGAAHLPGIRHILESGESEEDLEALSVVPPRSFLARMLPWMIPMIVIGLFVYGFIGGKTDVLREAAVAWILANGAFASLGALLALGHPLTIASAFVAAPLTSLNPTIGAGLVTGLVQVFVRPPAVRDMEGLGEELQSWRGWWRNRLGRVLLVFVFSNLGSTIGTFVAFGWLKDLL